MKRLLPFALLLTACGSPLTPDTAQMLELASGDTNVVLTDEQIEKMFPGAKIVHAKGKHTCWSSKNIGYSCNVENRMYNDCDTAVRKLRDTNCCRTMYKDPDGSSIGYTHLSCF